jgi:MFS family permease
VSGGQPTGSTRAHGHRADKVALVQTALSLPIMLIAMPAGAIADMYDRRIVALVALCIALSGTPPVRQTGLVVRRPVMRAV